MFPRQTKLQRLATYICWSHTYRKTLFPNKNEGTDSENKYVIRRACAEKKLEHVKHYNISTGSS